MRQGRSFFSACGTSGIRAETEAALAAAQAKAQDLLDQIHKGAKLKIWPKIFRWALGEGRRDLNYFKRGTLSKELEDKVFALKAGR